MSIATAGLIMLVGVVAVTLSIYFYDKHHKKHHISKHSH